VLLAQFQEARLAQHLLLDSLRPQVLGLLPHLSLALLLVQPLPRQLLAFLEQHLLQAHLS
ncbi:hypothetical protein, partial [Escherichia coli]|uniref:hypothetical protein n=1 Tax=Escherichia coli TaxID=562 RepID=UPI001EDBCCBC